MTLDEWLTQSGMSEATFAKMVGSSQPTINRIRHGKARADGCLIWAIHELTNGAVGIRDIPLRKDDRRINWTPEMLARVSRGVDQEEPPSRMAEAIGVPREALSAGLIILLRAERVRGGGPAR
ncbi:helix-turn-helix domain-containing protein [Arenibaculum pallidiluteum]|uniref:hypothetical protein n=1 Tax=Arenibaculum pallidiluteum TaxID=2812559 RepID=UPI001A973423|nr:hypothetical protein [Arenibaculum pallidiluteum]